jgi:acetyl esterase
MPLDPQLVPILDLLGERRELPITGLSPEEARAVTSAAITPREDEGLRAVEDIVIPSPDGDLPARVYRPAVDGTTPVVVFLHGGGWVIGSIETHDATAARLAAGSGCTLVSVEYRLAPETVFPGTLEDCYAATAWVAEHGDQLGVDTSRLAIAGDSAGGNLGAAVCLLARERGGPAIAFQLLIYPVTDVSGEYPSYRDNAEGYLLSADAMRWFIDHYVGDPSGADWRAAPVRADDLSGLPPALIITAEFDPLRDEGELFGRRLREAGVPVTVSRYDGMIHGFFGFPVDKAIEAREEAAAALRAALGT